MLDAMGQFDFTGEILDLTERLWASYEEAKGSSGGGAERLVGLAFILAVLRQDCDAVLDQVVNAPEVRGLDLAALLEEELEPLGPERQAALRTEMRRRGLLT